MLSSNAEPTCRETCWCGRATRHKRWTYLGLRLSCDWTESSLQHWMPWTCGFKLTSCCLKKKKSKKSIRVNKKSVGLLGGVWVARQDSCFSWPCVINLGWVAGFRVDAEEQLYLFKNSLKAAAAAGQVCWSWTLQISTKSRSTILSTCIGSSAASHQHYNTGSDWVLCKPNVRACHSVWFTQPNNGQNPERIMQTQFVSDGAERSLSPCAAWGRTLPPRWSGNRQAALMHNNPPKLAQQTWSHYDRSGAQHILSLFFFLFCFLVRLFLQVREQTEIPTFSLFRLIKCTRARTSDCVCSMWARTPVWVYVRVNVIATHRSWRCLDMPKQLLGESL